MTQAFTALFQAAAPLAAHNNAVKVCGDSFIIYNIKLVSLLLIAAFKLLMYCKLSTNLLYILL